MNTRRSFLRNASGLGTALAFPSLATAAERTGRRIDCHTHFYDPTRPQGVPWPPEKSPLYRRVLPDDWAAVATPHGVTQTVVVEASAWAEDNQFLLDLAAKDRRILGIIGNLDPTDAAFAANLKRFSANPIYRGIRLQSAKAAAPENEIAYRGAYVALTEAGLVLDLNGGPATAGVAAKIAVEYPDLTVVINHCGGAGDAGNPRTEEWLSGMAAAGKCSQVFCKVSALVEGVKGDAPSDMSYYLPILDPIWEAFGPDRLVYGSNWPVSDRGAPYKTVISLVSDYFQGKGEEAAENYFWKNSKTAYGWSERSA
ncbi:MAG: amidohydrolase family protein [Verrucomicrobiales bacterium]|jgi:L-fuconolactonase|nr:amidohydrolase family protein [Verrucomicrobiales bacterium]MBP9222519.1 amidohydrolase family protein [Verrucomicrobiales bacterium]